MSGRDFEFSNPEYVFFGIAIVIGWVTLILAVWYYVGENILIPLNIAVTTILTGSLVALYFKQARISGTQADMMRLQYEPDLTMGRRAAKENILYFEVKNEGQGTAIGVGLDNEVSLSNYDYFVQHIDLARVDKPNIHSNVLEPAESGVYAAELGFEFPNEVTERGPLSFPEAAQIVSENGFERIDMVFSIKYCNVLGEDQSYRHSRPLKIREGTYDIDRYFSDLSHLSTDVDEINIS